MKRVMITGPTGSIGLALISKCIQNEIYVTAVCRPRSGRIARIPDSPYVQVIECELSGLKDLAKKLPDKYDVFYHLGWDGTFGNARNNMQGQLENIRHTLDAVELAKEIGCEMFVGAGSQAEYGRVDMKLNGDTPTNPENGYGIAKLCAGQMSRIMCETYGMKHIWTRILSIYGPGDGDGTMVSTLIRQLLEGEVPACTKGEQIWDFLHASDAAKALYLLGAKGKHGKVYCIGSGEARPLAEYIKIIRDVINPNLKVDFGVVPYSDKQVMYLSADISDLVRDTGFQKDYTFEQGIVETVKWMKEALHNV